MALYDVSCPECRSTKKVHRKRRSGIRYAPFLDDAGIAVGEYRYYQLQCHACEALFYLQERRFYEFLDSTPQKLIVSETAFQKANLHKPGTLRIGNTASEYSVSIAGGADCAYALKRLTFNG